MHNRHHMTHRDFFLWGSLANFSLLNKNGTIQMYIRINHAMRYKHPKL
jgi:hypothetical protein